MSDWGQGATNNTNGFGQAPKNDKDIGNFGKLCFNSDRGQQTNISGEGGVVSNTKSMTSLNGGLFIPFETTDPILNMDSKSEFSFAFWVKIGSGTNSLSTILFNGDGRDINWDIQYRQGKGVPEIVCNINSTQLIVFAAPTVNTWNHIALRFNTTKGATNIYEAYLNNVLQTNLTVPSAVTTTNLTFTGAFCCLPVGTIQDEVRLNATAIFDKTLTPAEITQIYNNGTPTDITSLGPVVYYKDFDTAIYNGSEWIVQGSGTNTQELKSVNPNGIITDAP